MNSTQKEVLSKVPEVTLVFWIIKIFATTLGETGSDAVSISLGLGYLESTYIFAAVFIIAVATQMYAKAFHPVIYWLTIMFSQTLGTALGDWVADTQGLVYAASIFIFGGALTLIALAYYKTKVSHVVLFWLAFILTRPLGAVVGDFLDKPVADGGLALSRFSATSTLLFLIVFFIFTFKHRAAKSGH